VKKTNVDLIVGGSILISLIILIGGVLWLKDASLASKNHSYSILFPSVGTLQVGDPVMVNGVSSGSVSKIYLRKDKVAAVIDLDKTVTLTDSCHFTVQNIGLMGERGIGIQFQSNGTPIAANTKKDTTFLDGKFDTGIAEAMGMLGTVLGDVKSLVNNVQSIVEKTVGDTNFITLFKTLSARLDTITDVAQSIITKNEPAINSTLKNVQTISRDIKSLIDNNRGHIDAIAANGDILSDHAVKIGTQVETIMDSLQILVDQINQGRGSLGMLVKDEQFYTDLKTTITNLDTLINQVQGDALKLRIKFGFGKKKK